MFWLVNGAIMKILVRNLSRDTTEAELLALFGEYGAVQYCKLVMDRVTGKSKGFGFVEMPRAGQARVAIRELNAREIGGSRIRVKKAEQGGQGAAGKGPEATG
jgi:RNA recognition motif-containing protein